ncbi:MAG: acetyl-CoA carboxylase biotin carboxylase subunit [Elusimicrobia bacterium]|nr:acetyl-CoA carboxylase biotin carboxylase subunit [Elusimicrobiota bacterium]
MKHFNKILIANRGEIALRIIRTLKEMGIKSVAIFSEADRASLHVREANEAVCIGPAPSNESYLRIPQVLAAAKITGADAIHPGYGFLAENPDFSTACKKEGIVFIGPDAASMEKLGHKAMARAIAVKSKIPITPGTNGCISKNFLQGAKKIGYPLMVKAAAGGGGKGIRIVRDSSQLEREARMASAEAKAAFGNGDIYFEKYIANPRHVEIQFARDSKGNIVAFPERDCSIQRRHQKLLEESPSPAVDKKTREKLVSATIRLAETSKYVGVGTVEFLMDSNGNFYFMEVNTRLQVEHPVTEFITATDLVKEQILIAAGEKLSVNQAQVSNFRGHAIEHRINAEDVNNNFAPSPGKIEEFVLPGGQWVRVDTHIYQGYILPFYYDSLLAKLIIWGATREEAIARSKRALNEFFISGISTTLGLHKKIVNDEDFVKSKVSADFIERILAAKEISA